MSRRKMQHRQRRKKKKVSSHSNFSHALRRLKKLKANDQQEAMKMANASFIRQFCKVLKKLKRTKLSSKNRRALQKYRKQLRQLTNAKATISKQRRLLTQQGGGIIKSILSAIPVVGNILSVIDNV